MALRSFPERSYRSILKWGDPAVFYEVNDRLRAFIQASLGLSEEQMSSLHRPGLEEVTGAPPSALSGDDLTALDAIVGTDDLQTDDYTRARYAHGSTFLDAMRLRRGELRELPDAVVHPENEAEVMAVVSLCNERGIAIVPSGGRTSVTRAISAPRGGVALSLATHMHQVLEVNDTDLWARVQPGMLGPDYEAHLAHRGYTCGHFPQSFEHATVGGWVGARGAGQQSTHYGKVEDMIMAMRCVTPRGLVATEPFPRHAVGPDLTQMLTGAEGAFGVMTEVTLRIFPRPGKPLPLTFMFKGFADGLHAIRDLLQRRIGRPGVCRLSDAEETQAAMVLDGMAGGTIDRTLQRLGYHPGERALMIAATDGDAGAAVGTAARVHAIAMRHGGLPLGPKPLRSWSKRRFFDPYLREELMDMGVLTDTLETAVSWSNIERLWTGVRRVLKARPNTVALTHLSHAYETGANLYFIFLSPMQRGDEIADYEAFHGAIVEAIVAGGGSLSHHHGVGRLLAPWVRDALGEVGHGMLGALKAYLDPNGIMNPGVLGLGAQTGGETS